MLLPPTMRTLALVIWSVAIPAVHAQVEVNRSILLEGAASAERQVTGLDTVDLPGAVLAAGVEQAGTFRYNAPAAGAIWNVQLEGLEQVEAGTHIVVKVPEGNPSEVLVQVNGGNASGLEWEPGVPVDASMLPAGMTLSFVFNGANWQVMNGMDDRVRECPEGMVAVNGQFCIEQAQRSSTNFVVAANACAAASRRLCTWGELVASCPRRQALGLLTPSTNWEWTGNSANETNTVRTFRLTVCNSGGTKNMLSDSLSPYRCCITR